MKIQSHSLLKFIEHFKLAGNQDPICFRAVILYTTLHRQVQLPTEVHIVHHDINGMEVIYLLDPEVPKQGVPDIIDNLPLVQYRPYEYLFIKGHSAEDGNYILSIHPVSVSCHPATLQELYTKAYN